MSTMLNKYKMCTKGSFIIFLNNVHSYIELPIMCNSSFLFIILLAFKHTHLISSLDVLPCIPLHVLSSCTVLAFFD